MEIGSIITGAALPAAEAAAGVRAAPGQPDAGCPCRESARVPGYFSRPGHWPVKTIPHRENYPLWASFLTDMVAATRRYRHAVPPVRG